MKKKVYLIILIDLLLTVCAVMVFYQWNRLEERKQHASIIGVLYNDDKDAAYTVMSELFKHNYTKEDIQQGIDSAKLMGYTDKAFEMAQRDRINGPVFYLCEFLCLQSIIVCVCIFKICHRMQEQKMQLQLKIKESSLNDEKKEVELKKEQIQKYMENVTHQIKTPLTSMLLDMEILKEETDNDRVEDCINRIGLVKGLLIRLLQIGRLESGEKVMNFTEMNLSEALEVAVNNASGPIHIDTNYPMLCRYNGDFQWLYEAFSELVENTCEYANSRVNIMLDMKGTNYIIHIKGDGSFPVEDSSTNIFDRYYTTSDNAKSHFGIGLNLAKLVINAHFGNIIFSKVEGGTAFEIVLPIINMKNKTPV